MRFFELFSSALAGFYALIPSYGLAIILLTIAVRVVLLPLSIKQTKSMREMQRIQPELKKIQAKHKGNRQKMNEEMMVLYKEHGVNPFGGCLPLLMQFPVLIGLFYVVRTPLRYMGHIADSALAKALESTPLAVNQFLGLRLDCSSALSLRGQAPEGPTAGFSCGGGLIDALPYLVLVALMGFTTWYQQKQMQAGRPSNDATAQQMQMFAKIMPIMLMVFAFSFPTGVVLYWITTNIWTIAQQQIILRAVPANDAATDGGKKGGGKAGKAGNAKELTASSEGNGAARKKTGGSTRASTPAAKKNAGNGAATAKPSKAASGAKSSSGGTANKKKKKR